MVQHDLGMNLLQSETVDRIADQLPQALQEYTIWVPKLFCDNAQE